MVCYKSFVYCYYYAYIDVYMHVFNVFCTDLWSRPATTVCVNSVIPDLEITLAQGLWTQA